MKFQASIHGIDLEKEMKKKGVDIMEPQHDKVTKVESFKFGDPEDYKDMPMAEREALTEKMKKKYKAWAGDTCLDAVEKRG